MISEVFKFLFRVIVIGVLIVVVYIGAIAFNFFVIGPYRHMRNTEKAEVFNQEIWENGFAEIYTVSASIEYNQEIYSDSIEIICAPKMETSTITLKGGPSLFDYTRLTPKPESFDLR